MPRKRQLLPTQTFLAGFGLLYLLGVFYFLHVTFHDHRSYDAKDVNEVAADDGISVGRLKFSSREALMAFRYKRYNKAQNRPPMDGPGERGEPVKLTPDEQKEADRLFARETFNVIASDKVAMDRSIRDTRHPDCKNIQYPKDLPNASVIIVFNNEAFSPLVRTAHSIVNRSPPEYLHEIILLDDYSDRPELGDNLLQYVENTWPDGIVKVLRTNERSGLIRAKLTGAMAATGEVLIFLDAHCEVNDGWIEPILARIKEKRNVVLCPMIDAINDKTLEYSGQGGVQIGGFTWNGHFTWRMIPEAKRQGWHETDPISSPTMAGGLLAVGRSYFFEIGGYDPGMDVWGGENLEISFRTWMCGGSLEFIPCSRVGHIFRSAHPYTFPDHKDVHGLNTKRLAEVWMDDYKRLFYMYRKDLLDKDAGDISDRIALRKKLNCTSFKWYLDNVYPEKYIMDENVKAWGYLRNPHSNLCLDTLGKDEKKVISVGLFYCQMKNNVGISSNQIFSMSHQDEVRREEGCLDAVATSSNVQLVPCHGMKGHQEWYHDKKTGVVKHVSTDRCLDHNNAGSGGLVTLQICDGSSSQVWEFEHYSES